MTQRKPILATRVSPYVNQSVRRLTRGLGISISEYLRKLILQDLESRKLFQDELKEAGDQSEKSVAASSDTSRNIRNRVLEALRNEELQ